MDEAFFRDKVMIITGASSGIGLAAARLFAGYGANVVMAARSLEKMETEAATFPENSGKVLCIRTDVTVEEDCRLLVERTVEEFGRIDFLVNNAGISMRAMFNELDLAVIHKLMEVNFWGTVNCTKHALPHLVASHGSITGVISTAGYTPLPARTGYSASKYAVRGFLDTIRMEHMKDGLHVMVFAPGYTNTNIRNTALTKDGSEQGNTPLEEGKLMSADKVALKLARGLYHRRRELILTGLGKTAVVFRKLAPALSDRLTYRYISHEKDSPFK